MPDIEIPAFGSVDELFLTLLQDFFDGQGIHIGTLYTEEIEPPMILARAERRSGGIAEAVRDERFLQTALVSISTITSGIDADEVAEELQEAVRICLHQAQINQTVVPNGGVINRITLSAAPSRVSDYATSTGLVQYASLPSGWVRFESVWRVIVRSPPQSTITNRFITPKP